MGIGGPPATNFNSYYPGGKGGMSGSGGFYQGNSGSPMFGFGGASMTPVAAQSPFSNPFSPGVPFLNNSSFGPGFMPSPIMPQGMGTLSGTPFFNMYSSSGRFNPYGQTAPLSDPFNRPSFSYPYQFGGGYAPPTPAGSGYSGYMSTWNQPLGGDERVEAFNKLTSPGYWAGFETPRYKYDPSSGKVVPDGSYTFNPRSAFPESNPQFAPGSVADYINSPVLGIGPEPFGGPNIFSSLFDMTGPNTDDYNQPIDDPYEISDFTNTLDQFDLSRYDNYRSALTDYDIAASTPQENLSALLSSIDPSRGENPFLDSPRLYQNPLTGLGVDSYSQLNPERLKQGLLSGNIFNPTRYGEDSTYESYQMPDDYVSVISSNVGNPTTQETLAYDYNRDGYIDFNDLASSTVDSQGQPFGQDAFGFINEVRRIDSLLPGKLSEYEGSVTDWNSLNDFYKSLPKGQQERLFAQGPTRFGDPHTEEEKNKIIERYPEEFSEGWTRGLQDPLGFALNSLGNKAAPYMNDSNEILEAGLFSLYGPGFNSEQNGWSRYEANYGGHGGLANLVAKDRQNNNVKRYLSYDALSNAISGYTSHISDRRSGISENGRDKLLDPDTGNVRPEVLDGLVKLHSGFGPHEGPVNSFPDGSNYWHQSYYDAFDEVAQDLEISGEDLRNIAYLPGKNNVKFFKDFMTVHMEGLSPMLDDVKGLSPEEIDASVRALQQVDTIEHADFRFDDIDKDQIILQTSRFMSLADPGLTTGDGKWDVGLGSGMMSELSDSGAAERMEALQRQVNRASRGGVSVRQSVNGKITPDVVDSSNKFTRTMRNKLYSAIRDSGYEWSQGYAYGDSEELNLDRLLNEDSGFRAKDSNGDFLYNPLDQFETEVLPYVMGIPEHENWTDQSDLYDSSFQGNATGNFAVVRDFYNRVSRQYLDSGSYNNFMSEFDQTVADYMQGAGDNLNSSGLLKDRYDRYSPIGDPLTSGLISQTGSSGYYVPTFYNDDPLQGVSGQAYISKPSNPSDFYVPGPLGNSGGGMAYGGMASSPDEPVGEALLGRSKDGKNILDEFVKKNGFDKFLEKIDSRIDQGVPFASTVAPSGIDNVPGGMADDVPGIVDGKHPVRLSTGEYVIPADVVNRIGGGDSGSGAEKLMNMVDSIRLSRGGTSQ